MALFKTDSVKEDRGCLVDALLPINDLAEMVICKSPYKLKELIELITAYSSVHYVSDGDWSMHDLIMELLKRWAPAELFITTYALREFSVRQIILAQDRKELTSVNMLLDYRAKVRTPEVLQLASMNINRIRLMAIHAKVTVIRGAGGSAAIVTSANWTTNPRVEAGVITRQPDLVEFHIGWIQKLLDNAEIFE